MRYLHFRLTQELSRISRDGGDLCVIFLDLDNLKHVNDHHGHLAGSQVLREVGYLLKRTLTDERATLTRYGGDEFVLILPGHSLEEGVQAAERIREAIRGATFLSRPYGFNEPALNLHGRITASLGVSSIRSHAISDQRARLSTERRRHQSVARQAQLATRLVNGDGLRARN